MRRHNEIYTPHFGGLHSEIRILNSRDRFDMLDDYIGSFSDRHSKPNCSYLYLLISSYGEVYAQQETGFDLNSRKLERNRLIEHIGGVSDLQQKLPSRDLVYDERNRNFHFNPMLKKEITDLGFENLYPEFYGIEICIMFNTGYCQCHGLVTINGSEADSFYNARTIMK